MCYIKLTACLSAFKGKSSILSYFVCQRALQHGHNLSWGRTAETEIGVQSQTTEEGLLKRLSRPLQTLATESGIVSKAPQRVWGRSPDRKLCIMDARLPGKAKKKRPVTADVLSCKFKKYG